MAQGLTDQVVGSVDEPVVAALLLGKSAVAAERGMELVLDPSTELDSGALDAAGVPVRDLVTVLGNLIDNAIQAMPDGGTLTLRTAQENEHVLVEIGDTGGGIPEDVQSHIFDPFFTTKGVGEGTGLGLDTAYRIVRKHHGQITFQSQPGRTSFIVRLPVQQPLQS